MASEVNGDRSSEGDDTLPVDSFLNVNTTLIERGCLLKPLDVSEMSSEAKKSLATLLLSLLDQRQDDATFREQLATKLKVTDSSLERTKRFWKEEQDKAADMARKLESSKARVGTVVQELNESQSNLKRTKEELQKSKRDLLTVKQQINQQKLANERQVERLRSRFSDESIKLLRAKVPDVHFATEKILASSTSSRRSVATASSLERKQIEELENKRRELLESNAALKRFATESINLAREAATYLGRATIDQQEELASSSSSSTSASSRLAVRLPILYQRDLFPPLFALQSDYVVGPSKGFKQHPAVESLNLTSASIHQKGSKLLEILSTNTSMDSDERRRLARSTGDEMSSKRTVQETETHQEEQNRLLNRALQKVKELEAEVKRSEGDIARLQTRKEDREERIKQAAEVEKQRQRYLSLCRELEKQEELLRLERETLQRQQEEVLRAELSLTSTQGEEDSLVSMAESELITTVAPVKRYRDEEKENESSTDTNFQGKRLKVQQSSSTPTGDTMRFVTIRKQRARLQ